MKALPAHTAIAVLMLVSANTATCAQESGTVAYVCSEERSVGWEKRDGEEDAIGRFEPSDDKISIKWYPPSPPGTPLVLPKIEVSRGDEPAETMTFADCDFRPQPAASETQEADCREKIRNKPFHSTYGLPTDAVSFDVDPSKRLPRIKFTVYLNGIVYAYVDGGTCELTEE